MLRRGLRKQQREWCSPDTVSTFQDTLLGAPKNTSPCLSSWGNYPPTCSHLAERKPSQPFPQSSGLMRPLWGQFPFCPANLSSSRVLPAWYLSLPSAHS